MIDKLTECQLYIKQWYIDGWVITVEMDGGNPQDEVCMQYMVIELLRDLIDYPPPEGLLEGSKELANHFEIAFRHVLLGTDFGFTPPQEDAIKNLAFNYWAYGISATQSDPTLKDRLFKCERLQPTKH